MGGVKQATVVTTEVAELFIAPSFRTWVKLHTEQFAYKELMDDPKGVLEVPESRGMGQNGTNTEYADYVPRSKPMAKPQRMPTKFVVSRERRDQLLRERAAQERPHPIQVHR